METEAVLSRDLLTVVLGDGAGHLGGEPEALSPPRRANLVRVCETAIRRLGDRVSDPGGVHPRALPHLFGDASCSGDPVAIAYRGGVLAASRTANPDDDRGVRRMALLSRLTTQQMRAHYLFYSTLRRLLAANPKPGAMDFDSKRYRMATFVPGYHFVQAMGMAGGAANMGQMVTDILTGLGLELLLDGSNMGSESYLKKFFQTDAIRGEGIVFAPSVAGLQLFLWAFGAADANQGLFLAPEFECAVDGLPSVIEGAALVYSD